jgi:hypothetical protein
MFHFKGITIHKTFKFYFLIVIPWYSTDTYWVSWRRIKEKRLGDLKTKMLIQINFLEWFIIYDKQIVLDNMMSKYIEKITSMFSKICFGFTNLLLAFDLAFATNFIFKICSISNFRITH